MKDIYTAARSDFESEKWMKKNPNHHNNKTHQNPLWIAEFLPRFPTKKKTVLAVWSTE